MSLPQHAHPVKRFLRLRQAFFVLGIIWVPLYPCQQMLKKRCEKLPGINPRQKKKPRRMQANMNKQRRLKLHDVPTGRALEPKNFVTPLQSDIVKIIERNFSLKDVLVVTI